MSSRGTNSTLSVEWGGRESWSETALALLVSVSFCACFFRLRVCTMVFSLEYAMKVVFVALNFFCGTASSKQD